MGIFSFRRGVVIATVTAAALLPIQPLSWAQDAPTGSLSWGIRASFDNYTGGATFIEDGATRENNAFSFPLKSYSFDREAEHTEAQFSGTVRYRKYCSGGTEKDLTAVCQLDLTFKNPKVIIDKDGSYIEATVRSRQYGNNSFYEPKEPVKIATLATASGNFENQDGRVTWSRIPTRLTQEGVSMFSNFYEQGEGLDPLSFTATGEAARPSTDRGLSVFPTPWSKNAKYNVLHSLFPVGNNVLVAIAETGLSLINPEMKTISSIDVPLSKVGAGAYDAASGFYYFSETTPTAALSNELKRVKVDTTGFGSPETVGTVNGNIYAIGVHPKTQKAVVISVDNVTASSPADQQKAYLTPIEGSALGTPLSLPSTSELIGNQTKGDSVYAPRFLFGLTRTQLLPMDDGTFVYYGNSEPIIFPDGTGKAAKNVLLSINPSAESSKDAAIFMRGSQPEESTSYLEGYASNGSQIIRWNNNTVDSYAMVEVLNYAQRDVTSLGKKQPFVSGWANVTWDSDNNPVMLSGSNSKLIWFNPTTLTPIMTDGEPKEAVVPNGRETSNVYQGNMVATPNGSLYVPSLNESRGDFEEYYELIRFFDSKKQSETLEPTEEEKQRQKQREAEARKKLIKLNFDEAKVHLEKAKDDLAKTRDPQSIANAKRVVADAQRNFDQAAAEYYKEFPDQKPDDNTAPGGSGSSSPGAIAGIVIGVLALIGAVVAAISQFLPQLSGMFKNFRL